MALEKFYLQADPLLLKAVETLATAEGTSLELLFHEALSDLLQKRNLQPPRESVMAQVEASLQSFDPLYKKLAE